MIGANILLLSFGVPAIWTAILAGYIALQGRR